MPNLPAARRGDKTGHAVFHGAGGGGKASTAHGQAAGGGGAAEGAARGAHYGAAFAEGNGGVRLEHVGKASRPATKAGEGDQAGPVHTGSPNVLIGGTDKLAARAGVDVAQCPEHRHRELAEGSVTVLINGKPAARASEKLKCSGGHLLGGCETVLIGGDSGSSGSGGASSAAAVTAALSGDALANGALDAGAQAILGLDGADDDGDVMNGGDGGARGATAGAAVGDAGLGGASGVAVGATLA